MTTRTEIVDLKLREDDDLASYSVTLEVRVLVRFFGPLEAEERELCGRVRLDTGMYADPYMKPSAYRAVLIQLSQTILKAQSEIDEKQTSKLQDIYSKDSVRTVYTDYTEEGKLVGIGSPLRHPLFIGDPVIPAPLMGGSYSSGGTARDSSLDASRYVSGSSVRTGSSSGV